MDFIPNINISNFDYNLPEEKIAQFPLSKRDESKLLIVKNGNISEDFFKNLLNFLPENGLMIRNETRVIQARLLFCKESGAIIELFCLEPVLPIRELQLAFEQKSGVVWKCLVGNSRRWKSGKLRKNLINKGQNCILQAERVEQASGYSMIRFVWDPPDISLSEILMLAGITPLPPYVTREANETDAERYQTIYSRSEGSVAAPTAGLHFTDEVLQKLISKNISMKEVVLHVGAGTFKPVSNENIREHEMHAESDHKSGKQQFKKLLKN